jgi:hypothetical protein
MKVLISFLYLAVAILSSAMVSFAQAPDSLWTRVVGGVRYDEAECVRQTSDGGFIVGGYATPTTGNEDFYLVRLGANGDTLWTRRYGGNRSERCYAVVETSDGGFAAAGQTETYGAGTIDFWLVKTNSSGDTLWTHTYGGAGAEYCYMLIETPDLGFALVGRTTSFSGAGDSDVWLVKTNSSGALQWSKRYGGSSFELGWCVLRTSDDGYLLGGRTSSFGAGNEDFWLVKTNSTGDSLWSHTYGGVSVDRCYAVAETGDGGFALGGYTSSFGAGGTDYWLVRTNSSGDSLWSRTYGGAGADAGYFMRMTADGGFVLTGASASVEPNSDLWMVKTNSSGDSLWTTHFGGASQDGGFWVEQCPDGGFVSAGLTLSFGAGSGDVYVVRTGPDGPVYLPQGVIAQPLGTGNLRLAWQPDANNFYRIYSDTNVGGAFSTFVTSTNDTTVVLPGGATATSGFYLVKGSRVP